MPAFPLFLTKSAAPRIASGLISVSPAMAFLDLLPFRCRIVARFVGDMIRRRPGEQLDTFSCVCDAAILISWGFSFGVSVVLWSVARFLNTEKADWVLLFASMCVLMVPRACLPSHIGGYKMHLLCFIGFNFFTARPTWKINALCGKPSHCPTGFLPPCCFVRPCTPAAGSLVLRASVLWCGSAALAQ